MLETLDHCPICHGDQLAPVTNGNAPGSTCLQCGQVFLNPRMDDATAQAYYMGEYRDRVNQNNIYDARDAQRQRDRAHNQLHACWEYIDTARTALEIGCSLGYLMDLISVQFDTECVGVEPDTRYHEADPARKLKLYRQVWDIPRLQFDLVMMSHSLEHMQHPLEFIHAMRDMYMGEGSRFLIEVPNFGLTPGTLHDHHPYAFTEKTLNGLFERIGYKPLMMVRHGLNFSPLPFYLLAVYGRAPC